MEILLWLLPAAVVTLAAMAGVAWWGRESRAKDATDREVAARKLGEALARAEKRLPGYVAERRAPDRATGIALRPSKTRPVVIPGQAGSASGEEKTEVVEVVETQDKDRRAS